MPVVASAPTGRSPSSAWPGSVDRLDPGGSEGPAKLSSGHLIQPIAPGPGSVDHNVGADRGSVRQPDTCHPVCVLEHLHHLGLEANLTAAQTGGLDQILVGADGVGVAASGLEQERLPWLALVFNLPGEVEGLGT